MLVLSRRIGEAVSIERGIQVVVLDVINSQTVKLGFVAPAEVKIVREEVRKRDEEEASHGGT
jgi:carbon storage regulator CsrA